MQRRAVEARVPHEALHGLYGSGVDLHAGRACQFVGL